MGQVKLECVVEPNFGENAYVVWVADGGACWLIDPGLPPSVKKLLGIVRDHRLTPDAIVLTHAHADHIAGIPEVLEAYPELPAYLADEEASMLTNPHHNLSAAYGAGFATPVPTRHGLPAGAVLTLEGTEWRVLDVAGHSPGGRCLYCAAAGVALVGDALFAGSIGRTDFPHSDHERLIRNITEHLFTLPDETIVHSGHGPATTVGRERRTNPFVGEGALVD